jgi:nitrogen fixation NifU-like protein
MDALYRDYILDHYKNPRNFGELEPHDLEFHDHNPLCGDELGVHIRVEDGKVAELRFQGQGCAISKASASLMTGAVKDKTRAEAEALFELVHKLVTEGPEAVDKEALGKLAVLSGVNEFPARVKCASLAWHTLRAALEGRGEAVSTE